jgi:hypothetical protein
MFKVILNQPWAEMASAGLMTVAHIVRYATYGGIPRKD